MGCNKVVVNGQTLVDLTADTVDAAHLAEGYTAHDKAGALIQGSIPHRTAMDATITSATSFYIPPGIYTCGVRPVTDPNYEWDSFCFESDILMITNEEG